MLKKDITFKDFNGNERTLPYYFNLTRAELMSPEFSDETNINGTLGTVGEVQDAINRQSDNPEKLIEMIKASDMTNVVGGLQKFILASYGEKSEDGLSFIKMRGDHKLSDDFKQTAAYDALFREITGSDKAATEFIQGVLPDDMHAIVSLEDPNKVVDISTNK